MSEPETAASPKKRRPLLARLLGVVALLVLFAAPLGPALLRQLQPQLAVDAYFDRDFNEVARLVAKGKRLDDAPHDPWGNPWRVQILKVEENETAMVRHAELKHWVLGLESDPTSAIVLYSSGPDGRDDGGTGDDVFPVSRHASVWGPVSHLEHLLGALAVMLFWWCLCLFPRRRGMAAELVYALAMASVPAAFAVGGAVWTRQERSRKEALPATPLVLVPQEAAVVGSIAFLALLLGAGLRLVGAPRAAAKSGDEASD